MACSSTVMVPPLGTSTRERLSFVSWSSVTEDDAALAFTNGIISELAKQLRGGELSPPRVFDAAVKSFLDGGFRLGDPLGASLSPDIEQRARPHGNPVFSPAGQPDQVLLK